MAQSHGAQNVNALHQEEQEGASFNQRLAVKITHSVSNMATAYIFALLALLGLFGILGWLPPIIILMVTWTSQTFLQLCFLPILSVGQSVLSRHQELQSDEMYAHVNQMYEHVETLQDQLTRIEEHLSSLVLTLGSCKGCCACKTTTGKLEPPV